jgi:hypothetical protein
VRNVWAVSRTEGSRSPASEEMLSILVEVGASISARNAKRLELVA